uniref:hypothetical protein n=1 Tax=Pseudomonas aeruginosa TaxID=287 RepID=UPI001404C9FE
AESARQAVLTLYRPGAEPDPAIYDVIRRLPREHVPEILATGRAEWIDTDDTFLPQLPERTLAFGNLLRRLDPGPALRLHRPR